jgi:hypothetical protein
MQKMGPDSGQASSETPGTAQLDDLPIEVRNLLLLRT